MSWFDKARESLCRLWAEMDPAQFVPPRPELRRLNVVVGTSREQTDASIAAAQIARVMDKKVRLF